ncbi:hypothetical protein J2Z69_003547 [Paenibacillus shirakamiensis]|uniref:Uncharacterized protein n=1 Tax=Paenibacillus shirakamiensis TaxID=1265935 RepID=A0ABS4JL81_9BACL|nr:DUF6483 family protein [Paenibacillus shirakamiensis]MBP2002474.1 hypothetical protein [Paenibacillus shirakamiensis]
MLRRDYLLRMIEEMTESIGVALGLRQEKKRIEALWELDEQYKKHFRLDAQMMHALSVKDLIELFRFAGEIQTDKLQSAARLMMEESKIYLDDGKTREGVLRAIKALHLFLFAYVHGADSELWHLHDCVAELKRMLEDYTLPVETQKLILMYEEKRGQYDQSENALYRLLEQQAISPLEVLQYYERWLTVSSEVLEQGGLPLHEVREGIERMKARRDKIG